MSDIENWLTAARTLHSRLRGRSRAETFTPGSLAPELLRRSEELLEEAIEPIERMRVALESIAKNTCCDRCQEVALVAQAALKVS